MKQHRRSLRESDDMDDDELNVFDRIFMNKRKTSDDELNVFDKIFMNKRKRINKSNGILNVENFLNKNMYVNTYDGMLFVYDVTDGWFEEDDTFSVTGYDLLGREYKIFFKIDQSIINELDALRDEKSELEDDLNRLRYSDGDEYEESEILNRWDEIDTEIHNINET